MKRSVMTQDSLASHSKNCKLMPVYSTFDSFLNRTGQKSLTGRKIQLGTDEKKTLHKTENTNKL